MARMYPRTLLESEVKSTAETRVFDLLRDGLEFVPNFVEADDEGWTESPAALAVGGTDKPLLLSRQSRERSPGFQSR